MKIQTKRYWKKSIPSIITGAADNDPSGITTYSLSGAKFGYTQLWLMVLGIPMLIAVQGMCAKIANVTRKGLSSVLKDEFHPSIAWITAVALVISNVVIIGADILAVSLAFELITHIPMFIWIFPVTAGITYLMVFKNYQVIRKFLIWMVLFFFSYIAAAIFAHPDWLAVGKNLFFPPGLKIFNAGYIEVAVAVLGTTITPYLFFWQTKEELEEHPNRAASLRDAPHEDLINAPGYIFSQIITIFIIIAAAATIYQGHETILTAADAAKALTPVAGPVATLLFAFGIIGAGLLALPILAASTAEVVAETVGLKHHNLSNQPKRAKPFYIIMSLSLFAGLVLAVLKVDPLQALFYSQILAGLLSPLLLVLILILSNKKKLMGNFTNGWFDNLFGGLAFIVMACAAILFFVSKF